MRRIYIRRVPYTVFTYSYPYVVLKYYFRSQIFEMEISVLKSHEIKKHTFKHLMCACVHFMLIYAISKKLNSKNTLRLEKIINNGQGNQKSAK